MMSPFMKKFTDVITFVLIIVIFVLAVYNAFFDQSPRTIADSYCVANGYGLSSNFKFTRNTFFVNCTVFESCASNQECIRKNGATDEQAGQ